MLNVRNESVALYCQEDGSGLACVDVARGTRWALDEETVVYATKNDDGKLDWRKMRPLRAERTDAGSLRLTYGAGEDEVDVTYRVQPDYIEIVQSGQVSDRIQAYALPGSFVPAGEKLQFVLPIMQGMLWKGKGDPFEWKLDEGRHGGYSMPLAGYLGESGGLMVTSETQDDLQLWVGKDDRQRCWATYVQLASLGTMRYERRARLYVTDADHVAVAKTYRRKIIEQGRFKNWEEKIAERPALERLFGTLMCFIGYCKDDLDYAAESAKLKAYGFDRALIYPARFNTYHRDIHMGGLPPIDLSPEQVDRIKKLGFDVAPWTWINESMNDGTDTIRNRYRLSPEGEYIPSWRIDEQVWNQVCTTFMADYQREANAGVFADMSWDHFDVIACATMGECYALNHPAHPGRPLSRTEDREHIRKLLIAGQADGRPVSSEGFNDAYSALYDLGSVKAFPMFHHWPLWPIPLTMLVYHDSMIHSWWEMHSYNSHRFGHVKWHKMYEKGGGRPRLQAAMDALYGSPPDVFPFGTQYMWTGRGNETFAYSFRFEDPEVQHALREALPVAKLHGEVGKLELLSHRFLSEDGNVQETVFADGTRVVANFACDLRGDLPGIDPMQAESWRADRSS